MNNEMMLTRTKGGKAFTALVLAVVLLLVTASPAHAGAHAYHKSATYTNNGCSWYGVHEVAPSIMGTFWAAAGTYRVSGCVEVHVRLKVDNLPVIEDYDYSLANVVFSPMNTLKYSDHNANPPGAPPYVGFRFST